MPRQETGFFAALIKDLAPAFAGLGIYLVGLAVSMAGRAGI